MDFVQTGLAILTGLGAGTWLQGRSARRHSSEEAEKQRAYTSAEARATRQFGLRLDAYRAASTYLERIRLSVELTEPMHRASSGSPQIEPNDEWIRLGGHISMSASDEVRESMREVVQRFTTFRQAVRDFRREEQGHRPPADQQSAREIHEARISVFAAVDRAQTVMRDELAEL